MKKILVSLISVMSAVALSSCMGGGTAPADTVPASVKANEGYAMTMEKAAGTYYLETMDNIGDTTKDSYTLNTLVLGEDGSFSFEATVKELNETQNGTYSIGANGIITFEGDFAIVAKGETVVCNGSELTAEGRLGRATITMNYTKDEPEAEEPADNEVEEEQKDTDNKAEEESEENNSDVEEEETNSEADSEAETNPEEETESVE